MDSRLPWEHFGATAANDRPPIHVGWDTIGPVTPFMLCKLQINIQPLTRYCQAGQSKHWVWRWFDGMWLTMYYVSSLHMKVPPPKIDFTLPSPTVCLPLGHPPDCPWDARLILEEQQDKKKQDKKKTLDSGAGLKKQQERSEFLLRAVPLSMEATVGVNVAEDEKGELAHWLYLYFSHCWILISWSQICLLKCWHDRYRWEPFAWFHPFDCSLKIFKVTCILELMIAIHSLNSKHLPWLPFEDDANNSVLTEWGDDVCCPCVSMHTQKLLFR